jgi:hypothetical protein
MKAFFLKYLHFLKTKTPVPVKEKDNFCKNFSSVERGSVASMGRTLESGPSLYSLLYKRRSNDY